MTLPIPSEPISLLNIQLEYGGSFPISMNEYYGKGNAPANGQISLNDLYQVQVLSSKKTSGLVFDLDATNSSSYPGSGTTWFDISGNVRDFSLVNGPSAGVNAIEFDGVDDYAQIDNAAWIPQGTSPKSFECYARIDAWRIGQNTNFISKTSPSNQSFTFGIKESSGVVSIFLATQGSGGNFSETVDRYIIPNPSNYLGSYHHYAFTYNGSIAKIYIDGSLVFTSASGKLFRTNTAPMRLFCFDPSNAPFSWNVDGAMRGARMYNVELTAAEVLNNYQTWLYGSGSYLPRNNSTITLSPLTHDGNQFTLNFTFDQSVYEFTSSDITVTNGTKGTFTGITSSQYSLDITPTPRSSNIIVTIPSTSTINAGNKDNNAINSTISFYSLAAKSNVVVWLDATNSSSYSGIGTVWSDVAGQSTVYNAVLGNSPTFNSSSPKSFTFNGASQQFGYIGGPVQDDFTIACWFNTTTANGSGFTNYFYDGAGIIDTEYPGSFDFGLTMSAGYILFATGNDSARKSTNTLNDGIWHYAVGTRNSTTGAQILYIDNVVNSSIASGSGGNLRGATQINIARTASQAYNAYDPTKYFTGSISQVQIWNTVLTDAQVDTTWNNQKAYYGR